MVTDKERIAHLEGQLKNAEKLCRQLEARKEHHKKKCLNLAVDNDKKGVEILVLFDKNQKQTTELINHKARILDLEKGLENINTRYAELEVNHWALQANCDNLQYNLNLSQKEIRELEEAGGKLLKAYQSKEQKLNRYRDKLYNERNITTELEEVLDQKNYRITQITKDNNQQLAKEREIANIFFTNQQNILIDAYKKDRTNFLNALKNKQASIQELETYLDNIDDSLAQRTQTIINQNNIITQLQSQLTEINTNLNRKNQRITQLNNLLTARNNELNQARQDWQNSRHSYWIVNQKKNEIAEDLNELDNDYRNQEEVLIGKNTELAQTYTERNNFQLWIDNHACPVLPVHTCPPCLLIHLPAPHACPITKVEVEKVVEIEKGCPHSDYEELKKQLNQKESKVSERTQREIVERLNKVFNFQAQDLDQVISKLKELIDKPPLTVMDETTKKELEKAKELILKLEQQLSKKPPFGEKIETIIKIDEQLLKEHEALKVELNKQVKDYQSLAEERNKLVLEQIKNINVVKIQELIPQVQKQEIKNCLKQANNYEELSSQRNQLIVKYLNKTTDKQLIPTIDTKLLSKLSQQQKQERIILISLLVVGLASIGGLLVKLKKRNK